MLDSFLKVQLLWEETMASRIVEYLDGEKGDGKKMVVITGSMHIQHGYGVPKKVLRRMPAAAWELARRSEVHAKGMVLPGTLFEEMGFNYIGPVDGHDVSALVATLHNMRDLKGPQLLHVVTQKGKGYAPAEADPIKWHGPGPFDPASGQLQKEAPSGPSYSQVFGQWPNTQPTDPHK